MPDLGGYSLYILSAYGVSLTLIVGLVLRSVLRSAKVKAELDRLESKRKRA